MLDRAKKRPIVDIRIIAGVLGILNAVHGIALLVPIVIALVYNEPVWDAFLIPAIGSLLAGSFLFWKYKPTQEIRVREALILVSATWLSISLIGALPFILSGTLHSFTDAVFETMSGYTTTGATVFGGKSADGIENPLLINLPKTILFWRSLTHWIGGLGIVVLYLAIIPLFGVGGLQMYAAEASGPTADKLTPRVQDTAKILWFIYVVMTLAQFLLLWAHPSMDWFDSINHTFATVATGGFSTLDSSVKGFSSAYIDWVVTLFMVLAGVNFSLYYHAYKRDWSKILEDREFRMYMALSFGFALLATVALFFSGRFDLTNSLRYGVFNAISILTSTGFVTDDYEVWPHFGQALMLLALIVGGSAGSTTGGIKVIYLLIMMRTLKRERQLMLHPKAVIPVRLGSKVVSNQVLYAVTTFVLMYVITSIIGATAMSIAGLDLMTSFSAALTTLGNTGPGFGLIGPTENFAGIPYFAKWVQIFLMEIGRLEVITVVIIFTRSFWKQ